MTALFRDEVVQKRLTEIGVPLGITPGWMKLFSACLVAVLVAGALLVAFGNFARKARVTGFLVPDKGLIKVIAPHDGRISERQVEEGQHVQKDDVLFVVDVGSVTAAGRTADLVVQNLRERRKLIEQELERLKAVQASDSERLDVSIASLNDQISAIKTELEARRDYLRLTRSAFARNKTLEAREIYSQAQREKSELDVVSANMQLATLERAQVTSKGDLAQAIAQRHGLADKQANDRSQLERSLAEIGQQIVQIEDQRFLVVRAPGSGIATRVAAAIGAAADMATPLLTIVPDLPRLDAYLYVPSSAAGFVRDGAQVLSRYEAYPYQKFGVQEGRVVNISRTSVNAKGLPFPVSSDEPLYLVTATIAKTSVTAFGREEPLAAGAKFQANLVLENRKIWEWAIEPLLAVKAGL